MAGYKLVSRQVTLAQSNVAQPMATAGTHQAWVQNFIIKAKSTNAASVYIGDSTVNNLGFAIAPGAALDSSDLNEGASRELLSLVETYVYGAANDVVEILHEKRI